MQYRYPRFRRELLDEDSSFGSGPELGEDFPAFDLPTTEGERLSLEDLLGERPVLFTLASYT